MENNPQCECKDIFDEDYDVVISDELGIEENREKLDCEKPDILKN